MQHAKILASKLIFFTFIDKVLLYLATWLNVLAPVRRFSVSKIPKSLLFYFERIFSFVYLLI